MKHIHIALSVSCLSLTTLTACDGGSSSAEGEGEGEGEGDVDDVNDPGLAGRVLHLENTPAGVLCRYDATGALIDGRDDALVAEVPGRLGTRAGSPVLRFSRPVARDAADGCAASVIGGGATVAVSADEADALEAGDAVVVCADPGGCEVVPLVTSAAGQSTVYAPDIPLRSCRAFYDEVVVATDGTRTALVGDGAVHTASGAFDVGTDVVAEDAGALIYTMFDMVEVEAKHHVAVCALDRLQNNQTHLFLTTCASDDGAAALSCGGVRRVIGN